VIRAGATALFGALIILAACTTDAPYGALAGAGGIAGGASGGPGGTAGTATTGAAGEVSSGRGGGGATGGTPTQTGGAGGLAGSPSVGGMTGTGEGGSGGGATGGSGAGGLAGASGSGGATTPTLKLEYATASAVATTFAVRITNLGPSTPLISTIKARYYFTDDSANKMNGALVDSASWHLAATGNDVDVRVSGGCAVISTFPSPPASSYADIGCGLTSPLNANDTLTFTVHFDPNTQAAANDYSYLATAGTFQANLHMALFQNGQLVSGTAPF
jgi:hypothetical protein